jgi:hypothetical protein
MSGVAGKIGLETPMLPLVCHVQSDALPPQRFELEFCDHKLFTPLVFYTALFQFLSNTMERNEESTITLRTEVKFAQYPSLTFEDSFAGEKFNWVGPVVMEAPRQLSEIYSNAFEPIEMTGITIDATISTRIKASTIEEFSVLPSEAQSGEVLKVQVRLKPWREAPFYKTIELPIPEEVKSGEVEVIVADGAAVDRMMEAGFNRDRPLMNTTQFIHQLNERRRQDRLYVLMLKKSEGVYLQDQRLSSLPGSIRTLLRKDPQVQDPVRLDRSILWEQSFDLGQVIQGNRKGLVQVK